MNDLEKIKELRELKKISDAIKDLPRLMEQFDRLRFRAIWLMKEEVIPKWIIPHLDPRNVNLATDVLEVLEGKIRQRNHSSTKVSSPAEESNKVQIIGPRK